MLMFKSTHNKIVAELSSEIEHLKVRNFLQETWLKERDDTQKQYRIDRIAICALINLLNPKYGISEFSTERKAESDAIAAQVLAKLISEDEIQGRYR